MKNIIGTIALLLLSTGAYAENSCASLGEMLKYKTDEIETKKSGNEYDSYQGLPIADVTFYDNWRRRIYQPGGLSNPTEDITNYVAYNPTFVVLGKSTLVFENQNFIWKQTFCVCTGKIEGVVGQKGVDGMTVDGEMEDKLVSLECKEFN